jgi:hypothetical protein
MASQIPKTPVKDAGELSIVIAKDPVFAVTDVIELLGSTEVKGGDKIEQWYSLQILSSAVFSSLIPCV